LEYINIYLANLGRFNENWGGKSGEWVKLPVPPENIDAILKGIGIDQQRYSEYFIPAFETSFAICFGLDQGDSMKERGKYKLFSQIFDINSDVIITQADLCVLFGMPTALRNQFLIINKNATKETNNELVALIENSGVVTSAYCDISAGITDHITNISPSADDGRERSADTL
jgi:hypothetical protein